MKLPASRCRKYPPARASTLVCATLTCSSSASVSALKYPKTPTYWTASMLRKIRGYLDDNGYELKRYVDDGVREALNRATPPSRTGEPRKDREIPRQS